eukprot:3256165-Pleurochrysis_carterae.AAC.1
MASKLATRSLRRFSASIAAQAGNPAQGMVRAGLPSRAPNGATALFVHDKHLCGLRVCTIALRIHECRDHFTSAHPHNERREVGWRLRSGALPALELEHSCVLPFDGRSSRSVSASAGGS